MLFLFSPILLCNAVCKCIFCSFLSEMRIIYKRHICVFPTKQVRATPNWSGLIMNHLQVEWLLFHRLVVVVVGGGGWTENMCMYIYRDNDSVNRENVRCSSQLLRRPIRWMLNLRNTQLCVHFTLLKRIEDINISVIW